MDEEEALAQALALSLQAPDGIELKEGRLVFPAGLLNDLPLLKRRVCGRPDIIAVLLESEPSLAHAFLGDDGTDALARRESTAP